MTRSRRLFRHTLPLALILLVAGALRVWYASAQLDINRFEDERYSLQNVRKIYHLGDFEPASGYYPSPAFNLPQVWALEASQFAFRQTGRPRFEAVGENGRLLPTGFLLTRLYQTLCGVATLFFIFMIGRRLFDERVGLLAAALLAFLPWMVHSSGYNKPDALLVMSVCLSFWASLRAAQSAKPLDYMLAGAAISVAMSAKLTGGLIAVPLIIVTLLIMHENFLGQDLPPQDHLLRRVVLLVVAGASSALCFIALNPYWRAYLHFIEGLQRDYAGRTEASRLEIPLRVAKMHLDGQLFGPIFGAAAVAAFIFLLVSWSRGLVAGSRAALGRAPRGTVAEGLRTRQLAMFLSFPLAYTLAYAAQTSYFKPNNFLPLVPFTTLALAWLLDAAWRHFRLYLPSAAKRPAGWAAALLLVTVFFRPGYHYVERSVVPTTIDAARLWLHQSLEPAAARLVYREAWQAPSPVWEGTRQLHKGLSAENEVERLDLAAADGADAIIMRLDHPDREHLETLLSEAGFDHIVKHNPRWLRLRGPPIIAASKPWRRVGKQGSALSSCGPACLEATLPEELAAQEELSAFLWLPTSMAPPQQPPRLLVWAAADDAEHSLPLHIASRKGQGHLFVSPRFAASELRRLRLVADHDFGPGLKATQLEIHRWRLAETD